MDERLTFSRAKLAAFTACQRRFQLRYQQQLAWPLAPLDEQGEQARLRGERFHQLLHRHFLNLPITDEMIEGRTVARWWQTFKAQGPTLPQGQQFPELSLTVPIGRHLLTGRFDLLILGQEAAHIFDWKTDARPRTEADLRNDLQTQLYLALAVEGSTALEQPVDPDHLSLTYWYVNDPASAVTIPYSKQAHADNWAELESVVQEIDQQLSTETTLPLTDDLGECARCAYQIYCGRLTATMLLDEWEEEMLAVDLAPPTP
ncbi:MAG: PD-(D/E)XK nuclease family protein [Candidatus Promineifilaceae bacterium]